MWSRRLGIRRAPAMHTEPAQARYCPRFSSRGAGARSRPRRRAAPCPAARAARCARRPAGGPPRAAPRRRSSRPRDRRSAQQALQLGLDVERRLAARALAVGLRLEHLPHLGLAARRGARRRRPSRRVGGSSCSIDESCALADLRRARRRARAKAIAAIGIATRRSTRIASPLDSATSTVPQSRRPVAA